MGVPRPMGTRWSVKHGVAAPTPICGRDPRVRGVRLRSVIKIDPRAWAAGGCFFERSPPKGERLEREKGKPSTPRLFVGEIPACEERAREV